MKIFNPARPPSGAIPRFPIWEVTVMFFVAFAGVQGILTPDSQAIVAILGPWSGVWSASLVFSGLIALVGLVVPAPNGLIINLAGMLILTISSGAVLVSILILLDTLYFPGSVTLYVFTVGAILRTAQLMHQLKLLQASIQRIANLPGGDL